MGEELDNHLQIAMMLPPTPDGNIIFKTFELPKDATDDLKLNDKYNVVIEDAVIIN
jgi:hypothetical protein